jgi:hypothetical protein
LENDALRRRFRSVDDRIDATRQQLDHMSAQLSSQIAQARHDLAVLILRTLLLSTTIVVAAVCLLTIFLLP